MKTSSNRPDHPYSRTKKLLGVVPYGKENINSDEARRRVLGDEKVSFQDQDQSVPLPVESLQDFAETQALLGRYPQSFLEHGELVQRLVELKNLGASFSAKYRDRDELVGAYGALGALTGELTLSGLKIAFPQGGPVALVAQREALGAVLQTLVPASVAGVVEKAPPNVQAMHRYAYAVASKAHPELENAKDLAGVTPWSAFTDNQHLRSKETQAQFLDSFFQPYLEKSERGREILSFRQESPSGLRDLDVDHRLFQVALESNLSNDDYIDKIIDSLPKGSETKRLRTALLGRLRTESMRHVDRLLEGLPENVDTKKARLLLVEFAEEHPELRDAGSLAHGLGEFSRYQWRVSGGELTNPVVEAVFKSGLEFLSDTSPRASLVNRLLTHETHGGGLLRQRHQFRVFQLGLKQGAADDEFISDLLGACEPLRVKNLASCVAQTLRPELYAEVRDKTGSLQLSRLQETRDHLLLEALKRPDPPDVGDLVRDVLNDPSSPPSLDRTGLYRLLASTGSSFDRALVETAQELVSTSGDGGEAERLQAELFRLAAGSTGGPEALDAVLDRIESEPLRSYVKDRVGELADPRRREWGELAERAANLRTPDGRQAIVSESVRRILLEESEEASTLSAESYLQLVAEADPAEKSVLARHLGRELFPAEWEAAGGIADRLAEPGRSVWLPRLLGAALKVGEPTEQSILSEVKGSLLEQTREEKWPVDLGLLVLECEPKENYTAAAVKGYLYDDFGLSKRDAALARELVKSGLHSISASALLDRTLPLLEPAEQREFLQGVASHMLADPRLGVDDKVYAQVLSRELSESDLTWLLRTTDQAARERTKVPDDVRVEDELIVIGGEGLEVDL